MSINKDIDGKQRELYNEILEKVKTLSEISSLKFQLILEDLKKDLNVRVVR